MQIQVLALLKHHNFALPQGVKKVDEEPQIEDDESFHALKSSVSQYTTYIIDSGASKHMVSSKESFSALALSKGPNIHM